ncbi:hypothetical protein Glove_164g30 [Diversispora epigaea]|uniref:Uncharacterized protein n=1 Tax=Diversispora epigaea TaxID=1348612 RepID=A0A397IR96_9GLOM|nr:hypothetical protein Glove_164g30 [Diversispora epigaea]
MGGYNPLEWENMIINRNQPKSTKESFVFSLKTANMKDSILTYKDSGEYLKPIRSNEFISPSWIISEKSLFSDEKYKNNDYTR